MFSQQQIISQLNLNHGLFLDGYKIKPSKRAVLYESGEVKISLYKEQPLIYTSINDRNSNANSLRFPDNNNIRLDEALLPSPSDICINFPIFEITYVADLSESFSNFIGSDEILYKEYGHLFARKVLIGDRLYIDDFGSTILREHIDSFKALLTWVYNSAKYNKGNSLNKLSILKSFPKIRTSNGETLTTLESLTNWMNNLYQENALNIVSYNNLIPISKLKSSTSPSDAFPERLPGLANYKERLTLKEWVKDSVYDKLIGWVNEFHLFQGLIINKYLGLGISRRIAINLVKFPTVSSLNHNFYLKMIKPTSNLENFLISNNISPDNIKDISTLPFIESRVKPNDALKYENNIHFLLKCEQYRILLKKSEIQPSEEFKRAIDKALESMKPFMHLQDVFDEYGHFLPLSIGLGKSLRNILSNTSTIASNKKVDLGSSPFKSLNPYLDDFYISCLLTQKGNIIERSDLSNWIQNTDNNLETIGFDNLISLFDILEVERQKKIDAILYNKDDFKIIMTGIEDLKGLNIKNIEHYKRINIEPSLEDEYYEVFGSIVSKNYLRSDDFLVAFGLYDINGFSAMIKSLNSKNIDITECYVLWMIVGNPTKLSVFSPRNRTLQVHYIKESITLKPDNSYYSVKTSHQLTQEDVVSINVYSEIIDDIKLANWSENCIKFQIFEKSNETVNDGDSDFSRMSDSGCDSDNDNNDTDIKTAMTEDLHICILSSNSKILNIDNRERKCNSDLFGFTLKKEYFIEEKDKKDVSFVKNPDLGTKVTSSVKLPYSGMLQVTDFVKRPGLGKRGRHIKVRANFFEVTALPDTDIHRYDVTITPEVPPAINRKIYKHFEENHLVSKIKPVYDGHKNLYTAKPLPFGETATFDVALPEDDGASVGSFKVKIKKVAEINMKELHRFLDRKSKISNNILTGIVALDVLIRHKPSMMYATIGRSFYTNQITRALNGGLEAWQGYFQSIRPTPKKMMINIDLSIAAFYESDNLVQMAVKVLNKQSPDDLRRINDRDRTKLEKALKNLNIYVTHRGNNAAKRRLRINKLTSNPANQTRFEVDGQQVDVASYFQRQYNKRLRYPFLPCVVVRKETCLPMEICAVVEGQRYMRKLNEKQTADMIKFTCQPPNVRANEILINQGLQILNYRQNEYMQQFGLQVSSEMAVVQARVLPAPKLQYHPTSRDASFIPKGGTWNMSDKKVATGATLGSWACIVFGSERDYPIPAVQKFIKELITTCQDTGMNIPNKNPPIIHASNQGEIEKSLRQAWVKAGNLAKSQPQLILCILPNTSVQLYAEIKRVCDTVIGVASQCIQGRHMMQAKIQYCANVCLKMNVKLGGMNSFIEPTQMPFITQRPTIIMGACVTHPSPDDQGTGRPSIASLCASMDVKASRYAASIRVQTGKQEVISDLAEMVKELLKTFYQTCTRRPDRILFYRDGGSKGQFSIVLEHEIRAIRAACKSLDEKYKPTITFVVVQKRHHTRFFPMGEKDSDRTGNCQPGTVVESTICHPFEFDFYLQSHAGLQGTSRPTHYHVLLDENGFNSDSLQTLTYNLCYVFARSTRAVSLVPPVYYAHLVCYRARFHASGENWSDQGSDSSVSLNYAPVKSELLKVMYFM